MPAEMKIRWIARRDPYARLFRVIRVVWRHGVVGDGAGYSAKFTIGLQPRLWGWRRDFAGWILVIGGLRLHYERSYGGLHV